MPQITQLRVQNKLKQGKKEVTIDGLKCWYTGELNEENKCCGRGKASGPLLDYEGTFFDDNPHGVCESNMNL